jgi:8-oxo-dGTP pyrophosphatase MutT (NUDIX family)
MTTRERGSAARDRRAVHRQGDWHRCFHCVIVSGNGGERRLTLQRRGLDLEEYPGQIDVTVAGHLRAGEKLEDAATREIAEELGVEVSFDSMRAIGTYPLVVRTPQLWVRESTDVFVLRDERSVEAYRYDSTEVASLVSVRLLDGCALWLRERSEVVVSEYTDRGSAELSVRRSDFVNDVPDYWSWLAGLLTDRFAT